MAQHYLDPVQYILGKDDTSPVRIDYLGPRQHPEAVGRFNRLTLIYADGTEVVLDGDQSLRGEPFLRGSNGTTIWPCRTADGKVREWTTPEQAKFQMFTMKNKDGEDVDVRSVLAELPDPAVQQTDFMDSCRTRKRFCLNEEIGFRSCTMFNLAVVAERLGRGFAFDPVKLRAVNDEAADRFLYPTLREPWRTEFFKV